jgi:hypothetical protein
MSDIQQFIELLKSNNPNKRYNACEELRVSKQPLPQEAIDALHSATNDPNVAVANAAQRALALHAPMNTEKEKDTPQPGINLPVFKYGGGAMIAFVVTLAAYAAFASGCTYSNYQGNLVFIFIATWISWVALLSLIFGRKGTLHTLRGIVASLVIICVGAFWCIALTGFWIAPVCN